MPELGFGTVSLPEEGLRAIARERAHQVVKGFTAEHDAQHGPGLLISAALAYAVQAQDRVADAGGEEMGGDPCGFGPDDLWPWDSSTFSPTDDELESLAKAGALLAAAYDAALARRTGSPE